MNPKPMGWRLKPRCRQAGWNFGKAARNLLVWGRNPMEIGAKSRTFRPGTDAIKRLRFDPAARFRLQLPHRYPWLGARYFRAFSLESSSTEKILTR
jgi:hypothetical protein